MSEQGQPSQHPPQRNGKLAIPVPFDKALKKALEAKPEKPKPATDRAARTTRTR